MGIIKDERFHHIDHTDGGEHRHAGSTRLCRRQQIAVGRSII